MSVATALEPSTVTVIVPFDIEPISYPVIASRITELAAEYMPLTVSGVDDLNGMKLVRAARLNIKNVRVSVEKRRK